MKTIMKTLSVVVAALALVAGRAFAADDPNNPAAPHEPGIYNYDTAGKKMTKIEATQYGKTKQGFGFFAGYGQQTKQKAVIEGGSADTQISDRRPTFYFYFGSVSAGLGENATLSPDDYALSAMEIKDSGKTRRLVIGKSGVYAGSKSGVDKKAVRGFASEKVSPGVFKITVEQDLAPGEYCFFRPIGGAGTIFDFGVK